MLIDVAISGNRNVIKKEAKKILKYKDLTTEIQSMWNLKSKVTPVKKTGNWNHLKIIQKIPEQRTRETRNHGTSENSHIGHCKHISESTDVKVQ
jgi:hypothetical protein